MPVVTNVDGAGISPQELAEQLGVHRMTILKYIKLKEIKAVRYGRKWRIPPEEVRRLLREGYTVRGREELG
jgi:excisionase family DNA binding protein